MKLQKYNADRRNIQSRIVLRAKMLGIDKGQLMALSLDEIKALAKKKFLKIAKKYHPDSTYSKEINVPSYTRKNGKVVNGYKAKGTRGVSNRGVTFSLYQSAYDFIMSLNEEDLSPKNKTISTVPDIPNPWDTLRMAPRLPEGYGESRDHLWYQ